MFHIQRSAVQAAVAPIVLTGVLIPLPPSLTVLTNPKCVWQPYMPWSRRAPARYEHPARGVAGAVPSPSHDAPLVVQGGREECCANPKS